MADSAIDAATPAPEPIQRGRRKRLVRAQTIDVKRLPKSELELGRKLWPEETDPAVARPRTRGECSNVPRPCPFVSCVHHLYLDVSSRTGAIKLNFPDLEPDEMPAAASCTIDVADEGGATLERVGEVMNFTRERTRQVEIGAMAKVAATSSMMHLRDHLDAPPRVRRRLPLAK